MKAMSLLDMIFEKLDKLLKNENITYMRNEESRVKRLYDFIEYVPENISGANRGETSIRFIDEDFTNDIKEYTHVYAVDSSSRVLDTPYFFISIGSASAINRFKGFVIDIPDINTLFSTHIEGIDRFLALVPEIKPYRKDLFEYLKNIAYLENPLGRQYDPEYNKNIILDELRYRLENTILEKILDTGMSDSIIFIDGPTYYIPPLKSISKTGQTDLFEKIYLDSWIMLVKKRIELIRRLTENNNLVIGIVKRLYKTILLSRIDPMNIGGSRINDEAYLSIVVNTRINNSDMGKPFYIGPISYTAKELCNEIDLPGKIIYYMGIPKRRIYGYSGYQQYAFYRVEVLNHNHIDTDSDYILKPVIYDSLKAGTILPLSIILVDQRVKRISSSITRYIARKLTISGETTLRYLSL
jgi:hypothetical protein